MQMRAMLLGGLLELDEAYAYGVNAEPKGLHLLEFALWTEQREPIEKALAFFDREVEVLPGVLGLPLQARFVLQALQGNRKAGAEYLDCLLESVPQRQIGAHMYVNQATMYRLVGAKAKARKLVARTDDALKTEQAEVMQLARHYRNVLRLNIEGEPAGRATRFFNDMEQAGYRCLAGELN